MAKLNMTMGDLKEWIRDSEIILERVEEVGSEIGFFSNEYNTFDEGQTEFTEDAVCITAYDSHYDMYDAIVTSFPLEYLLEDESSHKDVYKNKKIEEDIANRKRALQQPTTKVVGLRGLSS